MSKKSVGFTMHHYAQNEWYDLNQKDEKSIGRTVVEMVLVSSEIRLLNKLRIISGKH